MVEAVMLWNEPNNLSHWDFKADPDWKRFADMVLSAAKAIRGVNPEMKLALGGISPPVRCGGSRASRTAQQVTGPGKTRSDHARVLGSRRGP